MVLLQVGSTWVPLQQFPSVDGDRHCKLLKWAKRVKITSSCQDSVPHDHKKSKLRFFKKEVCWCSCGPLWWSDGMVSHWWCWLYSSLHDWSNRLSQAILRLDKLAQHFTDANQLCQGQLLPWLDLPPFEHTLVIFLWFVKSRVLVRLSALVPTGAKNRFWVEINWTPLIIKRGKLIFRWLPKITTLLSIFFTSSFWLTLPLNCVVPAEPS